MMAGQGWATITLPPLPPRFPVRASRCASNLAVKGNPAGINPRTENGQHCRNELFASNNSFRHQESRHTDGNGLRDGNRQEGLEKSDG